MYNHSAKYYDKIYNWKDYKKESEKIRRLIRQYKKTRGRQLLDVACGTGNHIAFLKKWYNVEGLDLNPFMLRQARNKFPQIRFYRADMTRFKLNRQYDVVTCLFSAIGNAKNRSELVHTIRTMATHLKPGGILLLEPSISPDKWEDGKIGANFVNEPRLKIARMNVSGRRGTTAMMNMHHLIASPKGIEYFVEPLRMKLFKRGEYLDAFNLADLRVTYDKRGLEGRGLYLAAKPVK